MIIFHDPIGVSLAQPAKSKSGMKLRGFSITLPKSVSDLAPADELDVILCERGPELITREVIEIALPPSRTPIRSVCGPGLEFLVV